jgi:signal transduction histidine kinase
MLRRFPLRWRILGAAAFNVVAVLALAVSIWNGEQVLNWAWEDVRQTRESERLLNALETDSARLQGLIHRYFTQPNGALLSEINEQRQTLERLTRRAVADPVLSQSAEELMEATEGFVAGFSELRDVQATIGNTYENEMLRPAREMSGLYAIVESAGRDHPGLISPSLAQSREAFSNTLVLSNEYYLTHAASAAEEARRNLETIERTVPVMIDLADNDLQRGALRVLGGRAASWRLGLANLADGLETRARLLNEAIDGKQRAMAAAIDRLSGSMQQRERLASLRFDRTLANVSVKMAAFAVVFLAMIILIGVVIAASISRPLRDLMGAMHAIVAGNYARRAHDLDARDEIGEMARAIEVFRENAIARRKAEQELLASKERAERALDELREAQQNLIEAEKFAALGSLVAGVAHEVNNPVGISLTVASSLSQRCDVFTEEVRQGVIRRSKLEEFIAMTRVAAQQLVANLLRAAELIQSFKQVAVDRSHAGQRLFDLREATDQIVASVRPELRKSPVNLLVDIPDGIVMDSFAGAYGQVVTNLFLNALVHAFPGGGAGVMRLQARRLGHEQVEIQFSDNGIGMSDQVQRRAFDPFFTTRRSQGGTGLGLHIVYNLVTGRLGGRIKLESQPERGTTFTIVLPLMAPKEHVEATVKVAAAVGSRW